MPPIDVFPDTSPSFVQFFTLLPFPMIPPAPPYLHLVPVITMSPVFVQFVICALYPIMPPTILYPVTLAWLVQFSIKLAYCPIIPPVCPAPLISPEISKFLIIVYSVDPLPNSPILLPNP